MCASLSKSSAQHRSNKARRRGETLFSHKQRYTISHTLYLQSSPPLTIVLFTGFQSHASTAPSCAFHLCCLLAPGPAPAPPLPIDLTTRNFPCASSTASPSPDQQQQYTPDAALSPSEAIAALSLLRSVRSDDHMRTAASSPTVASAVPSWFHRTQVTAPVCADLATASTRPCRPIMRTLPSAPPAAKTSLPPPLWPLELPAVGYQSIVSACVSIAQTAPPARGATAVVVVPDADPDILDLMPELPDAEMPHLYTFCSGREREGVCVCVCVVAMQNCGNERSAEGRVTRCRRQKSCWRLHHWMDVHIRMTVLMHICISLFLLSFGVCTNISPCHRNMRKSLPRHRQCLQASRPLHPLHSSNGGSTQRSSLERAVSCWTLTFPLPQPCPCPRACHPHHSHSRFPHPALPSPPPLHSPPASFFPHHHHVLSTAAFSSLRPRSSLVSHVLPLHRIFPTQRSA